MKARRGFAALVCAAMALVLPVAAAARTTEGITLSSFKLGESNGYDVEFSAARYNERRPAAVVSVNRAAANATYTVRTPNGDGIHATFGTLGQVDLSFQRRKKAVERPERNCRWVIETGFFRGSFRFVGEGGYFASEAVDPEGFVMRLPDGFCGLGDFRPGLPPGLPSETVLAAQAQTGAREVSFRASRLRNDRGSNRFSATTNERVEGMEITRSVRIPGQQGDFTATGASRGAASPPPPFSGSARFRDPRDGPATWTGTLTASLPGLEGVPLAGEGFTARLCPHLSFLASCLSRRTGRASGTATAAAPTPSPWRWPGFPR